MSTLDEQIDGLKQKKYLVAFLDFLGASKKMTSPEESEIFLNQINEIYKKTTETLDIFNKVAYQAEYRIFSDNIVLAIEYKQEKLQDEIDDIIAFSAMFQALSLTKGLLVRGAITCGNFYINKNFVYGDALVKSHAMESEVAIYPRIIVDEKIFGTTDIKSSQIIHRDFDGELFVNFLKPLTNLKDDGEARHIEIFIDNITAIRNSIIGNFEKLVDEMHEEVIQKHCWLAKTFNDLCDELKIKDQKLSNIPKINYLQ